MAFVNVTTTLPIFFDAFLKSDLSSDLYSVALPSLFHAIAIFKFAISPTAAPISLISGANIFD